MTVLGLPNDAAAQQPQQAGPTAPLDIRHIVIDDCLHPLRANGVYQVARLLALEQIRAGDDARIVLFGAPDRAVEDSVLDVRTDLLPLIGGKFLGRVVRLSPKILTTLLARTGPRTIFHIHGARQTLLWWLSRALLRRGLAYAITVHGRYSHLYDRRGRSVRRMPVLYLKTVERAVLNSARFVQAVSATEMAIIKHVAPNARVELIPNAAFSSALVGVSPAPRRSPRSPRFPVFGFCGRYEIEHKGLDLLVEGFARYRRLGGRGYLELIGTGPAREELAALADERGVGQFVDAGGPRFGDEKLCALRSWDYFVQPSRFEGFPVGPLEAAFLGLPLIVTAETGLQTEVVSFEAGVPIGGLTADAVAKAFSVAEGAAPQAWTRMSHNAHAMAVSIGDWTGIAAQLRLLYESA
jgi:glycosyltransferase involved in cell wall biosynthesis